MAKQEAKTRMEVLRGWKIERRENRKRQKKEEHEREEGAAGGDW